MKEYSTGTIKNIENEHYYNFNVGYDGFVFITTIMMSDDFEKQRKLTDFIQEKHKSMDDLSAWGIPKITFCETINETQYMITFDKGDK